MQFREEAGLVWDKTYINNQEFIIYFDRERIKQTQPEHSEKKNVSEGHTRISRYQTN